MKRIVYGVTLMTIVGAVAAQEKIELESIYVKANKEFPQSLYVIPWKEIKGQERQEQRLVLHSLYGTLFDPVAKSLDPSRPRENLKK